MQKCTTKMTMYPSTTARIDLTIPTSLCPSHGARLQKTRIRGGCRQQAATSSSQSEKEPRSRIFRGFVSIELRRLEARPADRVQEFFNLHLPSSRTREVALQQR